MREDGFRDLFKKVERFFTKKKNIKLTPAEIEAIVMALQASDQQARSVLPAGKANVYGELLEYVTQYQDAMTERKKQKIVRFLTQRGLKSHITRKCK